MAQNQAVSFDLYRESSLGKVLIDALDELCNENKLPVDLAVKILKEFDKVSWWGGASVSLNSIL